jgi:heme-degrading monooxygenase HmoA
MIYQSHLDSMKEQTGLTPNDRRAGTLIVSQCQGRRGGQLTNRRLLTRSRARQWRLLDGPRCHTPKLNAPNLIGKHVSATRSSWSPPTTNSSRSPDVWRLITQVGSSYFIPLRNREKLAIVKVATDRLDVGIKLKGAELAGRLKCLGQMELDRQAPVEPNRRWRREPESWLRDAGAKTQRRDIKCEPTHRKRRAEMPALPWVSRQPNDPNAEYVAMASRLPLHHYRSVPGFLRDSMTIRRQLAKTPGLIGYGLNAELTKRTFWTFSVWENREALDAFARTDPHRRIIERLRHLMEPTHFELFPLSGRQLPMTWEQMKAPVRPR